MTITASYQDTGKTTCSSRCTGDRLIKAVSCYRPGIGTRCEINTNSVAATLIEVVNIAV